MPHLLAQQTIVCEGWVSVCVAEPQQSTADRADANDDDNAVPTATTRALPGIKRKPSLRRRSLDALRGVMLGVFGAGGGGNGGGGRGSNAKAVNSSTTREEGWRMCKAWLDDAAVLYLDGWTTVDGAGNSNAGSELVVPGESAGEELELMVPKAVMDMKDAYTEIRAKKKKKKKGRGLDIWDRRAWDAGAGGLGSAISLPSTASQTSLFCVSAAAPPCAPHITPFRVLASSLDPAAADILLTVDPLPVITSISTTTAGMPPSSSTSSSRLPPPPPPPPPSAPTNKHDKRQPPNHQQLRMHFTSTRKLARWSAALTLALCVSHATTRRRHATMVQAQRRRPPWSDDGNVEPTTGCDNGDNGCAPARASSSGVHVVDDAEDDGDDDILQRCGDAERAARAAQRELRRTERRVRHERAERAKQVAELYTVEQVQDVYQETANALAAAQHRITTLSSLIATERADLARTKAALAALRAQRDPLRAAASYASLQMRHEDLARRYKELRQDAVVGKAMWEREREAHAALAERVRLKAMEGVDAAGAGAGAGFERFSLPAEAGAGDMGVDFLPPPPPLSTALGCEMPAPLEKIGEVFRHEETEKEKKNKNKEDEEHQQQQQERSTLPPPQPPPPLSGKKPAPIFAASPSHPHPAPAPPPLYPTPPASLSSSSSLSSRVIWRKYSSEQIE
ncbi:hypothetical protein HDU86_006005 [Geranomyces michiganensis]|nr:hypothetical protein HDU86_006005 [Geranomyces michiganensis]